jgi:competence protein ComEC
MFYPHTGIHPSLARLPMRCLRWLAAAALLPAVGCDGEAAELPAGGAVDIYFVDVGEGDAIVMRLPDGRAVVYDGGKDRRALLAALEELGVDSVTLLIASHSHSDHVGGLARVIQRNPPRYILENGLPHHTRRYHEFAAAVTLSNAELLPPTRQTLLLGEILVHVVPPPFNEDWGHNDNSIGVIVEFGSFRASFLGDSEPALQNWWLDNHSDLLGRVGIHKASHHGSRKGDIPRMMRQLCPEVVVVGTDFGSQYPHRDVVEMYERHGAQVLRTDLHGTVHVRGYADGSFQVRARGGDQRRAALHSARAYPLRVPSLTRSAAYCDRP